MLNDSSVSQFLRDNPELWFIALGIFYLLTYDNRIDLFAV